MSSDRRLTAARTAAHIDDALRHEAPADALRWVAELIEEVRRAPESVRAELLQEPAPPTGDERWDALIAGVVEDVCYRHGLAVPGWTVQAERFLERWWFVTDVEGLAASAFTETPAALGNRGVFIHRASLESV